MKKYLSKYRRKISFNQEKLDKAMFLLRKIIEDNLITNEEMRQRNNLLHQQEGSHSPEEKEKSLFDFQSKEGTHSPLVKERRNSSQMKKEDLKMLIEIMRK